MTKLQKGFRSTKKEQKKKIDDAIIVLNDIVNVRLAPSSIHGIGVFALRDLKEGEKLNLDAIPHAFDVPYKRFKELDQHVQDILVGQYPLITMGSNFLYPVTRFICYVNHSDISNYDAKEDKAKCVIKAGEEITEDYRLIDNYKKVFAWL